MSILKSTALATAFTIFSFNSFAADLRYVYALAANNSMDLRAEKMGLEAASEDINVADAALLPSVNLSDPGQAVQPRIRHEYFNSNYLRIKL